jgi:hypothetical protein
MCGPNPTVEAGGVHVQMTHRTLAVLLVLHLIGVVMMLRKRRATEAPVVVKAAHIALGMVILQLVVASAMVLMHLPPLLRSLHEATGVGIWLSCFVLAYLARRADPAGRPERSEGPGLVGPVSERAKAVAVAPASPITFETAPVVEEAAPVVAEVASVIEPEPVVEPEPELEIISEAIAASEELDWEPRRAHVEEIDEFSLPPEPVGFQTAEVEETPEVSAGPQASGPTGQQAEVVAGDSSLVAPPVEAPKLTPLPAHTMAVIVARGADLL